MSEHQFLEITPNGRNGHKKILIDTQDLPLVYGFKWYVCHDKSHPYAIASKHINGKKQKIIMHRLIMCPDKTQVIDHINGNTLDNRRANLRVVTKAENAINQTKARGLSQFKGVSWKEQQGKWVAKIRQNGTQKHLGYFENEVDAAVTYDLQAIQQWGDISSTNFPKRLYELFSLPSSLLETYRLEREVLEAAEAMDTENHKTYGFLLHADKTAARYDCATDSIIPIDNPLELGTWADNSNRLSAAVEALQAHKGKE